MSVSHLHSGVLQPHKNTSHMQATRLMAYAQNFCTAVRRQVGKSVGCNVKGGDRFSRSLIDCLAQVALPMSELVESLNAGVVAGLAFFQSCEA